jgi:hypothetical protein
VKFGALTACCPHRTIKTGSDKYKKTYSKSLELRLSDGQRIIKIGLVLETLSCFDQNICRTLKVIVADMSH